MLNCERKMLATVLKFFAWCGVNVIMNALCREAIGSERIWFTTMFKN